MRLCDFDVATNIYGAGGPTMGFGGGGAAVGTGYSSTSSSSTSTASFSYQGIDNGNSHISYRANDSTSGDNSSENVRPVTISTILGNLFGTDTGVTDGKRDDGRPIGAGCGDAKTDDKVPDRLFGHDLSPACTAHDIAVSTCGVSQKVADAKLGSDIDKAMGGGLVGAIVGAIYQGAVSTFGTGAYNAAQAEAGCTKDGD